MDARLAKLLKVVVEEYVSTAEPVGSQSLVERYHLDVSPATIRNWFTELEAEGYLTQPHTSGGRVPTEKGFRTYIELFVQPKPPTKRDREALQKAAAPQPSESRRFRDVAKILAERSGGATVVGMDGAHAFYTGLAQLLTQPEFHHWQHAVSLTEVLDRLDETLRALHHQSFIEPTILLGDDCPFGATCGVIIASVDDAFIGILGPVRMDYQLGLSLLSSALELLQ